MNLSLEKGLNNKFSNMSFEQLIICDMTQSKHLGNDLAIAEQMMVGYENLVAIRNYISRNGVTSDLMELVDTKGELSAIIGDTTDTEVALERLDDTLTELGSKISAFFSNVFRRVDHKLSTWFPSMNRYETIFNEQLRKLGNRKPNPSWIEKSVRGPKKSRYNELIKLRVDGLAALKKCSTGLKGDVDSMLSYFNETVISRLGGLFAIYKKDGLLNKIFMKNKLSTLGYSTGDAAFIISTGKKLSEVYSGYRTTLTDINAEYEKMDEKIRRALNNKDKETAKDLEKRMARIRSFFIHMMSFVYVSLDQMEDEMSFCAYSVKAMVSSLED